MLFERLSPSQDNRVHCSGKYLVPVAPVSQGVQSAHSLCLGSRLAEQPRGLGRGHRCAHRPGRGRGCSERLSEEPGEAKRVQRGPRSSSHRLGVLLPPEQISFKVCHHLLFLPARKTAKIQIFVEVKFCVVSSLYAQNSGSGPFLWSVCDSIGDKKVLRWLNTLLPESL